MFLTNEGQVSDLPLETKCLGCRHPPPRKTLQGVILADNTYSDPDDTSINGSSGTTIIIAK